MGADDAICKGGSGTILPFVHIENQTVGAILYLIALLWFFQGVSIIADIFMCAIEKITSAKQTVICIVDGQEQTKTMKVWNKTVANLTLMALGSSAPEILLSLIELLQLGMHSGDLGPSTIVGSAAFNLLVITAVCISALPAGEHRVIQDIAVFGVTAFFSVFAYLWLIIILVWVTPDVVDVVEGVLTFIYFPILVTIAYFADIGTFHRVIGATREKKLVFTPSETTKEDYDKMVAFIKAKYGEVPEEPDKLEALLHYEFSQDVSRAARRMQAIRDLSAQSGIRKDNTYVLGSDVADTLNKGLQGQGQKLNTIVPTADAGVATDIKGKSIVQFVSSCHAVSEAAKTVSIKVRRTGNTSDQASIKFRTIDHTAKSGEDFEFKEGKIEFNPGVTEQAIDIKIFEDHKLEGTEEFFVELSNSTRESNTIVGKQNVTTVVVLDSDAVGTIQFDKRSFEVAEPSKPTVIRIPVKRVSGATGSVSCKYKTEDGTAIATKDYTPVSKEPEKPDSNVLRFAAGQLESSILIEVLPVKRTDAKEENFRLILFEPEGGVTFTGDTNLEKDELTLTVNIVTDPDGSKMYEATMAAAAATKDVVNWDSVAVGRQNWGQQFKDAMRPGGEDGDEAPSPLDWAFHVWSLPFKLLFALVPPVDFCGGWLCFFCALGMIGVVTAMIGDTANLLGCALDMKAPICAVTFVALGTSLPDTFASKTAAVQENTADNSIGNVTGSNSVNVFLGLGLPWMIGAFYWSVQGATEKWTEKGLESDWPSHVWTDYGNDGAFVVVSGNLGGSVTVFVCCAMACIGLLLSRRKMDAELGGNRTMALASSAFLVCLWFIYIGMAIYFEGGISGYE